MQDSRCARLHRCARISHSEWHLTLPDATKSSRGWVCGCRLDVCILRDLLGKRRFRFQVASREHGKAALGPCAYAHV